MCQLEHIDVIMEKNGRQRSISRRFLGKRDSRTAFLLEAFQKSVFVVQFKHQKNAIIQLVFLFRKKKIEVYLNV